jgi:hypothetical protein
VLVDLFLELLLKQEDEAITFIRNVNILLPDYMMLHVAIYTHCYATTTKKQQQYGCCYAIATTVMLATLEKQMFPITSVPKSYN